MAKKIKKKSTKKAVKKTVKKVVKKSTKKSIKKSTRKTAKKALKKAVTKKTSAKKTVKKAAKKTSRKTVKKVAKKTAKKTVKKAAKKAAKKKTVRKSSKKAVKKTVKKKATRKALPKKSAVKKKAGSSASRKTKESDSELLKKAAAAAGIPLVPKGAQKKKVETESTRAKQLTPMRIYLNQIESIPLLLPKEELELSRLIQNKLEGWKQARRKMIQSNLRLVINIAKRYMNLGLPFSDLVEEGNIGLMRAVDKFNYKRGYRFSTYASWWIKQGMMRALSNQGKLIRIPVHMFESMTKWRKIREYLMQKSGKIPTHKEIAKLMEVSVKKVKEIEHAAKTYPSSLHAPVSIDGDAELIDLIEDNKQTSPDREAHDAFKGERIKEFLDFVSDREKSILIMRFGLFDTDRHTLEEAAQVFGITRERIRQIEEAALKKIRAKLEESNDKLENYL